MYKGGRVKGLINTKDQQKKKPRHILIFVFHCQTLPDQQHAYYLRDVGESSLDQTAKMVSRVPFTHPTNVANILNLLRRQLLFNTIISSCIRPYAKQGQLYLEPFRKQGHLFTELYALLVMLCIQLYTIYGTSLENMNFKTMVKVTKCTCIFTHR